MLFCDEIFKAVNNVQNYGTFLDSLVNKPIVQKDIDAFLTKVTGYNVKDYKDLTTRKRNILDKINACIAVEIQNTKANQFSLLQGITRYTTHDISSGTLENVLFNTTAVKMNEEAHKALLCLN
jgi:ribosome-associated toxin RatA of RatAB toxin-antitoxin module